MIPSSFSILLHLSNFSHNHTRVSFRIIVLTVSSRQISFSQGPLSRHPLSAWLGYLGVIWFEYMHPCISLAFILADHLWNVGRSGWVTGNPRSFVTPPCFVRVYPSHLLFSPLLSWHDFVCWTCILDWSLGWDPWSLGGSSCPNLSINWCRSARVMTLSYASLGESLSLAEASSLWPQWGYGFD